MLDRDPVWRQRGEPKKADGATIGPTAVLHRQDHRTVWSDEGSTAGAGTGPVVDDRILRMQPPWSGKAIGVGGVEFALVAGFGANNREEHPPPAVVANQRGLGPRHSGQERGFAHPAERELARPIERDLAGPPALGDHKDLVGILDKIWI